MKTRKELKEEYKQLKFRMGVFKIVNNTNGKIFIGSSPDLVAAWNSQRFQLNAGLHESEELQKDWKNFGPENFSYEIIEEIKQNDDAETDYRKEIKALEELLIEELQPNGERGYNRPKKL